jgi:hypothetical protein
MNISLFVLLGSALYATARYHLLNDISWEDWPIYTLNKAFALSSLLLLVLSLHRKHTGAPDPNPYNPQIAGLFGAMHVMLSLILLSPAYYEKFYIQGKLTPAAGLSMVLGAAAAFVMFAGPGMRQNQRTDGGVRILAILAFAIGLHAMLQGFAGWFAPSKWPGMMPPITLISFLLGLAAALYTLFHKPAA